MKISKLFHWLYAILMLLPFAFFVPSVFYYAFNDNATMQTVEVPQTETIAVDFNQVATYIPNWTINGISYTQNESATFLNGTQDSVPQYGICPLTAQYSFKRDNSQYLIKINTDYVNGRYGISGYGAYSTDVTEFIWSRSAESNWNGQIFIYTSSVTTFNNYFEVQCFDLTQMFGRGNEPTINQFNEWFTASYYEPTQSELMQITYETGTTEQLIENTSIINYAWESIWNLPLFSWTKVTFVSVPFSYLTGIFGIGASNSLNYVFGYFVTISIVWLVFDLLLYVPMLAHNWIDKARIE